MRVSLVMTAYQRSDLLDWTLRSIRDQVFDGEVIVVEDGYDGGLTRAVCNAHGAKWLCRKDRPAIAYSNQSVPLNMGIRAAQGEVLILQNAECKHVSERLIANLCSVGPNQALFARCVSLRQDGTEGEDYCSTANPRPFFFCGSILRKNMPEFDEGYVGYGWEDDDMAEQLKRNGISFVFRDDLVVHHQWHKSFWLGDAEAAKLQELNRERFRVKYA